MNDEQTRLMLKNRERAHLRLLAIEAITHDRLADAMITLSQLLTDPEPMTTGTCRVCGCTDSKPCGIYHYANLLDGEMTLLTCTWLDQDHTLCSNLCCLETWKRLNPEATYVQTSAESRIVTP